MITEDTTKLIEEACRECRDILPFGSALPRAEFILWGKFFPQEAFGPKCAEHARKWFPLERVDQYAVYDLRPVDSLRAENERLRTMWDKSGKNDLIAERDALRAQLDKTREFCEMALRAKVADSSPAECAMAALAAVIKREALEVSE